MKDGINYRIDIESKGGRISLGRGFFLLQALLLEASEGSSRRGGRSREKKRGGGEMRGEQGRKRGGKGEEKEIK